MAKQFPTGFEQENALLFAKMEDLAGLVEERIAKIKKYEQQILGLQFELEKLNDEKLKLKDQVNTLKKESEELQNKVKFLDGLKGQNFSIQNKIAKIVTDIDSQEVSAGDIRELIQTMIDEIDDCIRLLQ